MSGLGVGAGNRYNKYSITGIKIGKNAGRLFAEGKKIGRRYAKDIIKVKNIVKDFISKQNGGSNSSSGYYGEPEHDEPANEEPVSNLYSGYYEEPVSNLYSGYYEEPDHDEPANEVPEQEPFFEEYETAEYEEEENFDYCSCE